ncbi:family 20 glycosylhydrolase [Flavobacterium algicola]|uniref:family 20 glycosylhydrolase n=1 Tax=Flavobacterium algicola TaxID=556529 RepID=UPI001EFE3FA1|nr:family 20 glycosylhydrolase [Flavobacterium algicola]MCG9793145.1 family 20 glycosylhydrolase [Flavobacterium algicola]
MKKTVFIIVTVLISFCGQAQEYKNTFIPQPESVVMQSGGFKLGNTTQVFISKSMYADLKPIVASKMSSDNGLQLDVKSGRVSSKSNYISFEIVKDKKIQSEGYILEVKPSQITIKATDYAGLFNGFQTLRQAIPMGSKGETAIPSMIITDNPRFHWRGVLADVSRHFQTKEFLLKQIDVISSYKINTFHLHLTDDQGWRIEIKKYPNLTKKGAWRAGRTGIAWWSREAATAEEPKTVGGFYTQEDLKEIIAYAKVRNVEIIPEIDVPAHSKALIAAYPYLFCYDKVPEGVNFEVAVGGKAPDNALCAGKETTYAFLEDVIKEVAALFPSKYFHIGGDECNKSNWKKCPHCQKVMKDNNLKDEEELQSYFIQRMHKIVTAQKKVMIGWDEVLSGNGVKGATIMAWRRGIHTPEIKAPREGYPTIMTSYLHSYISRVQGPMFMEPEGPLSVLPLSVVYNHEPVPSELTAAEAKRVIGNQVSLWGEFTPTESHFEYMLYPRTLASAEVSWSNPKVKNWERFQDALEFDHFARLERDKVNFSKSMFTVYPAFAIDQLNNEAIVFLKTETVGYTIYYTLNGEDPTMAEGTKYMGDFKTTPKTLLKAGLFNEKGELLSTITEIRLK